MATGTTTYANKGPVVDAGTITTANITTNFNNILKYGGSQSDRSDREPIRYNLKSSVKSFTGRQHELKEIQKNLQYEKEESSSSRSAVIIGVGGTGKTELARKYAQENSEYYTNIVWVDSETSGTMRSTFETLAETLGIIKNEQKYRIEVIIIKVYKYLSESKTLLIFDNAEGYGTIEQFIKGNVKNIHCLFTSQVKEWTVMDEDISLSEVHLEDLLPEHAKEFVKKSLNQNDVVDEEIEKLIEELACFPLALTQAVAYINQQHQNSLKLRSNEGYGIGNYLKELRLEEKKLLDHTNTIHHRYGNTVFNTLQLTIEKLSKERNGKEAADVLSIIAYLAPDDIHIFEMFEVDENTVLLLDKYSMIKIIEGVASIHRLLQQVIRLRNQDKEIKNLKKALITVSKRNGSDESIYLNHVIFVWTHAVKHKVFIEKATSTYRYDAYNSYCPLELFVINNNFEEIDVMLAHIPVQKLDICNDDYLLDLALQNNCSLNIVKLLVQYISPVRFDTLRKAVEYNINLDIVKYLKENGSEVNAKDEEGHTVLYHTAASNENVEVLKYLIENGAEVNVKDEFDRTPLHAAAEYNENVEFLKYLIENGADVNVKDENGRTPLHAAAERNGNVECVKYLIESGADVNAKAENGQTPLSAAISGILFYAATENNKNVEFLKYLIENGADVNVKDEYGITPLHAAARHNENVELLKCLIENGAGVNVKDVNGRTPLHAAAYNNKNVEVLKYLIENGAEVNAKDENGRTPLHAAAEYNENVVFLKSLIENGAEVNAKDENGRTPLHAAAEDNKNVESLKCLIENGADVNAKDENGKTPLSAAISGILLYNENVESLACLIENVSEVNVKDENDRTPLHAAAENNENVEFVKCLIENGADVNVKDENGRTPLHAAAGDNKNIALLQFLIENGAKINAKDDHGHTPLHAAADDYANVEFLKCLIENGADVNAKNKNGRTPLHGTVENDENIESLKCLIENGADLNAKDNNGRTPLHLAADNENMYIIDCLIANGADKKAKDNSGAVYKKRKNCCRIG